MKLRVLVVSNVRSCGKGLNSILAQRGGVDVSAPSMCHMPGIAVRSCTRM